MQTFTNLFSQECDLNLGVEMHRVTLEGVQTSAITMWHSLRVIFPQSLVLTWWWWHSWTRSWWHSSWSSTNTSWHPWGSETETLKKTMSIANILFMVNLTLACSNYLQTTLQQLDHCGRGVEEELIEVRLASLVPSRLGGERSCFFWLFWTFSSDRDRKLLACGGESHVSLVTRPSSENYWHWSCCAALGDWSRVIK